jgi:O-antigen ligase
MSEHREVDSRRARVRSRSGTAGSADEPARNDVQGSDAARLAKRGSNAIAAWILFIAIAGAPLPFGSRDAITVAFWCALLGAGLLFASPRYLRRPHLWLLAGIAVIIAGYGFVLHEQLAAHPWIAQLNPIWAKTSELLGRSITPSVSIVRDEPLYALGAPLAAVLALVLGLIVGADRARARQTLVVAAWAGVAYAAYGILSLFLDPSMVLWREKVAYIGSLTATFINRNTAATYFGSCAAVWLILLMEVARGRLPRGPIAWGKAPGHILTDMPSGLVVRFVMFFVCLAALFLTASRAGVLISLLVLAIEFLIFFRRDLRHGKSLLVAVLATGALALLLLQVMGGYVETRIEAGGLSDVGRLSAWRSTLRLIADNPWFGTGLGTFAWAFPAYRSSDISTWGIWDRAHSTPLELAAELGIPLAALIALAWLVALAVLIRSLRGSRRNYPVPLTALCVALIALVHSAIDFSLQVSGYALVVLALVGVGLAQSFNVGVDEPVQRRRRERKAEAVV